MAISYTDPWSGSSATTCSVSAGYAAKHAESLKARGLTEAQWVKQKHLGTWGVVKGKLLAGTAPDLPFAIYKSGANTWKIGVKNGKILAHNESGFDFLPDTEAFEEVWVKGALNNGDWTWVGVHTPKAGPVDLTTVSKGALTDVDAATLFVKTKDEFAASKGINIKGANPALDNEVFQAIANETGYTAAEVKAKVNAYKASGKKLSALKKKAVPKKAPTTTPPPAPPQPPVNVPAPSAVPKKALPDPDAPDPGAVASKHTYFLDEMDKGNFTVEDIKFFAEHSKSPVTKKAAQDVLDDLNGPTAVPPATLPTAVPTAAADDVVSAAVQAITDATPEYFDEQVAKAYIKAKDQLAADPHNPWTLYTQNNTEFDNAIYNLMAKSYDIDLGPNKIKAQIANYIATTKKLSVLKKQMAKTGEYVPQADSLKKKKGDPSSVGKQSKTAAQQTIADAADAGYVPDGAKGYTFSDAEEGFVFAHLKNKLYAGMSNDNVYQTIEASLKSLNDTYMALQSKPFTMLDVVRAYDKKKAADLGIPNGNFYEKKIAEYAASPSGQAAIKAKQQAADLIANLPPLPADSAGFQVYDVAQARQLQREMTASEPWTAAQRSGLTTYTGGSYRPMNSALRQGRTPVSPTREAQAGMRPTTAQLLVHRGTGFSNFGVNSFEEVLQLVGKTVQEKGFTSTSVGGRGAFSGEVNMEIEVPKGTHGAFVKDISNFSNENEFILAAGTQYEVLTVSKTGYQTTVRVRAIPGSHTRF